MAVLSRLAPAVVARGEVSYDCRWTGRPGQMAMECVGCSSGAVTERPDQTAQGYRRFRCRNCDKQFNERSDGENNQHQLTFQRRLAARRRRRCLLASSRSRHLHAALANR
jgi:hypothetical protein